MWPADEKFYQALPCKLTISVGVLLVNQILLVLNYLNKPKHNYMMNFMPSMEIMKIYS